MEINGLLVLVFLVAIVYVIRKMYSMSPPSEPDIKINNVKLSPPTGSVLKANEPIYVTFDYE